MGGRGRAARESRGHAAAAPVRRLRDMADRHAGRDSDLAERLRRQGQASRPVADIPVDPGLKEDRYLKGVQIIPTKGYTVIHHIRTSIVEPSDDTLGSGRLDDTDGSLEVGEQGVFLN